MKYEVRKMPHVQFKGDKNNPSARYWCVVQLDEDDGSVKQVDGGWELSKPEAEALAADLTNKAQ